MDSGGKWRGWSPRDKLKRDTRANATFESVVVPEDECVRQPRSSRRHTLEIRFKKLGQSISKGRRKTTSQFYSDVGTVLDEVDDAKSTGSKDKAATLPARLPLASADVKLEMKSKKISRHPTLVLRLLGKRFTKERQKQAEDGQKDITDKTDMTEVGHADDRAVPVVADVGVTTSSAKEEDSKEKRGRKRLRHTLTMGSLWQAVNPGGHEASQFYHDDSDHGDGKVKTSQNEEVRLANKISIGAHLLNSLSSHYKSRSSLCSHFVWISSSKT